MTKRIFALLLALALCLSLFGCKPKNEEDPTGTSATSTGETNAADETNAAGDSADPGSSDSTDGADASEESKSDFENWGAGEVGL